ncbi:hypothetical protein BTVI_14885 [Pitangus sulphuratus]|nr:hypothetical protein BTVI_14885 [Pitangus sulphuratus]
MLCKTRPVKILSWSSDLLDYEDQDGIEKDGIEALITTVLLVIKCQDSLENVTPCGIHKGSLPIAVTYST